MFTHSRHDQSEWASNARCNSVSFDGFGVFARNQDTQPRLKDLQPWSCRRRRIHPLRDLWCHDVDSLWWKRWWVDWQLCAPRSPSEYWSWQWRVALPAHSGRWWWNLGVSKWLPIAQPTAMCGEMGRVNMPPYRFGLMVLGNECQENIVNTPRITLRDAYSLAIQIRSNA